MVETALLLRFAIALALGLLVGLEREYARYKGRGHKHAGIRTYALIAIFGSLSAYIGQSVNIWIFVVASILLGAFVIAGYFAIAEHERKYIGATSEIAAFVVFFVGALCVYGELRLATLVTIAITTILYARSILHNLAKHMSKQEMTDTLKFAIIAFVILPFLPNQGYGPHELFNPYIIWLMVILISGISFVGYILMKLYGEKGIPLAGFLGGIVSSVAVTTSFATRSKKQVSLYRPLSLGILLANGIMLGRVLIEVAAVNRELLIKMLLPVGILAVITLILCYFLWHKAKPVKQDIELGTPFSLWPALRFALLLSFALTIIKLAGIYLSHTGVYFVSALSGFADVDAAALSLSHLAGKTLDFTTARNGILLAVITNMGTKGAIAYSMGSPKFGKLVISLFSVLIVGGLAIIFLL
ncbi:MgtC/SapB family protein [Candidatus Woesearchaeota archaeon]|nr:MgtC/SapB family protein [Candidatus Woesearchaeota archaeon]